MQDARISRRLIFEKNADWLEHTPQVHWTASNRFGMDAGGVLDSVGTLVEQFWSIFPDSVAILLAGAAQR